MRIDALDAVNGRLNVSRHQQIGLLHESKTGFCTQSSFLNRLSCLAGAMTGSTGHLKERGLPCAARATPDRPKVRDCSLMIVAGVHGGLLEELLERGGDGPRVDHLKTVVGLDLFGIETEKIDRCVWQYRSACRWPPRLDISADASGVLAPRLSLRIECRVNAMLDLFVHARILALSNATLSF